MNSEGLIWFSHVPVGRNQLSIITQNMCIEAGITGRKTNHSLRATGATELYLAGVPEQVIKERTGHRSIVYMKTLAKNKI